MAKENIALDFLLRMIIIKPPNKILLTHHDTKRTPDHIASYLKPAHAILTAASVREQHRYLARPQGSANNP